jgi:hypothetical protein
MDLVEDEVVLLVLLEDVVVGLTGCVLRRVRVADELGLQVHLEGRLEKEGNVVEEEPEGEGPQLVLHDRDVVEVVGPQVQLGLLQQLLRLLLVTDQLLLLSVHLGLQGAEPPVEIMFAEHVRNLVVVFQSILKVHLGRSILVLAVLDVPNGGLAAGRAQPAALLRKLSSGSVEESLGL